VAFIFRYDLEGLGFATAALGDGERTLELTATFHRDSLAEFAESVVRLTEGAGAAHAVFVDEFGEHHVEFRRAGEQVALSVTRHPDASNRELCPLGESAPVFSVSTTVTELHSAIIAALGRLLEVHGVAGYRAKWLEHDFPLEAYRSLAGA